MGEKKPILIMQMQRMGDLVLTFPLIIWLARRHPGRPIWVLAEKIFYTGLMSISPRVTYFPWEGFNVLKKEQFRLLINLSHRTKAADLAGALEAEEKLGPVRTPSGETYIHGNWLLYRAAIVRNNRHNLYHWADMNALDSVPAELLRSTTWPGPKNFQSDRVGLFLGASQEEKRPSAAFWAGLAEELARRGLRPVLLGGPAEAGLGRETAALARTPCLDLCGRFSLPQLIRVFHTLSLLIAPDTGPTHLASWTGLKTLNLSMGPVNPWETGPYAPGHYVLSPSFSCSGCWECSHPSPYRCRDLFSPGPVAALAQRLAQGKKWFESKIPGMRLSVTGRDDFGLYDLKPVRPEASLSARQAASEFWRRFFGRAFGLHGQEPAARAWETLMESRPVLGRVLAKGAARLAGELGRSLKPAARPRLDQEFWLNRPPIVRPLAGHLQLLLQNSDYSRPGRLQALELLEQLTGLIAR